jgi:hypothetical protein
MMSVERLERVLWRVRKTAKGKIKIHNIVLERAIMMECGTDPLTIRNNRNALKRLGWIGTIGKTQFKLTDKDLTGD